MNKKCLLVLGASTYQLDAIQTAQRIGYEVITTDNVPANPGHAIADRSWPIDTTNVDKVIAWAHKDRIDGVLAPCTDVAVNTAAAVAEALGLPGVPLKATRILTSKLAFRRYLVEQGLPHPEAHQIGLGGAPDPRLFRHRRWIIKPNRASGSKCVFILDSFHDFENRVAEAIGYSADGIAVLEEFLEGTQHTCEGVLAGGRIGFHLVTDRATAPPPYVATTGHAVPSRLGQGPRAALLALLEHIFGLLGVQDTVFDCDFVADGSAVTVIEVTPRLGGNSLSALVRAACNVDLVKFAVRQACGDALELPRMVDARPTIICILGVDQAGILDYDERALGLLSGESWVHHLKMDHVPGAAVCRFINGRNRVGEAILHAPQRDALDALPKRLLGELRLAVVSGFA